MLWWGISRGRNTATVLTPEIRAINAGRSTQRIWSAAGTGSHRSSLVPRMRRGRRPWKPASPLAQPGSSPSAGTGSSDSFLIIEADSRTASTSWSSVFHAVLLRRMDSTPVTQPDIIQRQLGKSQVMGANDTPIVRALWRPAAAGFTLIVAAAIAGPLRSQFLMLFFVRLIRQRMLKVMIHSCQCSLLPFRSWPRLEIRISRNSCCSSWHPEWPAIGWPAEVVRRGGQAA